VVDPVAEPAARASVAMAGWSMGTPSAGGGRPVLLVHAYLRASPRPQGVCDVSIEQNKAIVRRYITEVLVGGDVELIDALLAPDYVNRGMGGMDRAGFKAWLSVASAGPGGGMQIEDLVAEGDVVVARFSYAITLPDGEDVTARGLSYYRLSGDRIVEDDAITTPDLRQVFAAQMPTTAP
jgi:ketosteroid isomerase-like protein